MKRALLVSVLVIVSLAGFSAVKTWTGTNGTLWSDPLNWSPGGVPSNGDEVLMTATGINRNITGFTTVSLAKLTVSNASGYTTYSIRSASDQTLTLTGGAGDDLQVDAGCGLTIRDHLLFIIDPGCTALVEGNLTFNLTNTAHGLVFSTGTTTTVNGSLSLVGSSAGGSVTCDFGSLIDGFGNITHAIGSMTVDGNINFEGNFINTAPISGLGTIETTGAWSNASTLFGYPYTPPGTIISGFTWSGATDNDWSDPENWYGGSVPDAAGDVVIYNELVFPLLTAPAQECKRLYIHDDGSQMTIGPGGQLNVYGTATLGGGEGTGGNIALIIGSSQSGCGSFINYDAINGSGIVDMQRFFDYGTSGLWHYTCIPVTQLNAWAYLSQYMKYYSEPEHHFKYVIAMVDSVLDSDGMGYAVWPRFSDWTAHNAGIPFTSDLNIPVTRSYDSNTSDYDGWNMAGNPFLSAVDLSLLTGSWTNVDATAWFWDPYAGNYKVYPSGGGGSHSQYCPAAQGFFVHCNDPSATPSSPGFGNMVVTQAARVHNTEPFLKEIMSDILRINVKGSPNEYSDDISVYFNDNLTEGYDPGFDALKKTGEESAPQLYTTIPGNDLSVNALPMTQAETIIPLSFKSPLQGSFVLTASDMESFQPDVRITLEDLETGLMQDLRSEPEYTFANQPGDDPARFLIRFTVPGLGMGKDLHGSMINIYSSNNYITVASTGPNFMTGTVTVTDLVGRLVFSHSLNGVSSYRFSLPASGGYYLVKVVSDLGTSIRKIYLD